MRFKPTTPEGLETREMFSAAPTTIAAPQSQSPIDSLTSPYSREEFLLQQNDEAERTVVLRNDSEFTAEFTLKFNGNISVNLEDLVDQIRNWDAPGVNDLPDYEKAYHYLLEFHQHDFPVSGRTWMHEPSLYLNSLGAGFCDDAASALSLIWKGMGYESRIWLLKGHVVSEVHADERWQMFDADLRVVYRNRAGLVAGVEELVANPDLITNPQQRDAGNPFVYSNRIASIYSTDDNEICTGCIGYTQSRDLVFQLPAGASIEFGEEHEFERGIPAAVSQAPETLGQMRLNIPGGFDGTIDIPLALYDVQGELGDSVNISGVDAALGTDESFDLFNVDARTGNRIHDLEFDGSQGPVEVVYFFNSQFTQIEDVNSVEIEHRTEAVPEISVAFESPVAEKWTFADVAAANFQNQSYVDVSDSEVATLFDGEKSFELNAVVQPDSAAVRKPIFDTFRVSLELDEQNRPYAYYRSEAGRWVGIKGPELSTEKLSRVRVTYENGLLRMFVNSRPVRMVTKVSPIDSSYPLHGPYIGKSDHVGGLYFEGTIQSVSVHEIRGDQQPEFRAAEVSSLKSDAPVAERAAAVSESPFVIPAGIKTAEPSSQSALENLLSAAVFASRRR